VWPVVLRGYAKRFLELGSGINWSLLQEKSLGFKQQRFKIPFIFLA